MTLIELCRMPDTTEGHSARVLLWSLWNHHRSCNLWTHVCSLSSQPRREFGDIIACTIEAREAAIRAIFTKAGEFERIDTHPINSDQQ